MLNVRNPLVFLILWCAVSLHAATYIVPSDRDLIRRADAVVVATPIESHAEMTESGSIVTISTLHLEEVIKGRVEESDLRLTEPGGMLADRALLIAGSPRFDAGKRYLLFLRAAGAKTWTTYGLQIGQFEFTADLQGRALLARTGGESLFGLNESDGSPYIDRLRDAGTFMHFARVIGRTPAAPIADSYAVANDALLTPFPEFRPRAMGTLHIAPMFIRPDYLLAGNPRWQNPTVSFGYCCPGNYPASNGVNAPAAAQSGVQAWNGNGSIQYGWLGETPAKTAGFTTQDGANTVLFNDPNNDLSCCPGAVAIGGTWTTGTFSNLGDGVTYMNVVEADVVVNKNSSFQSFLTQRLLVALLTHEVGHTLGFRHSDGTADPNSPPPNCAPPSPCAGVGSAMMAHTILSPGLTSLQEWDIAAAKTVYGSGVSCTNPAITAQPQNTAIAAGGSATLTVSATGTSLTYQWFSGTPNSGSPMPGMTQSTIIVSPTATTTYYVVVSACGTSIASDAATITVRNTGACGTNPNQLCINNARYRITLSATDPGGKTGQGVAQYQSNVFGYFSLPTFTGDPGNPEVFVKVVEPAPGQPWVFYAGLTNLDYTINVSDTQGSFNKSYHVAPPPASSFQNFGNFDVDGATSTSCANVAITSANTLVGSCTTDGSTLCLLNRFAVTLQAKDNPTRSNNQSPGAAVPVNNVFGFFTTPALSGDPTDIQAFVKMIDATSLTGKFWVFLGGLTDFDLTFTVTDMTTGKQKIYNKPAGSTCGWNDTSAF